MPESVVTVNLEADYPTVEEARQLLKAELEKCRNRKVTAVKIIHGYGSSGVRWRVASRHPKVSD